MLRKNKNYISSKGIEIFYKSQEAASDRNHLVVIFTGFGTRYDFLNIANLFRCQVIWIEDKYLNEECYYLGKDNKLDFADSCNELITSILNEYNIEHQNCTLVGDSKGGFAALYFGIHYQYKNIIASAFTTKIANRMHTMRPNVAKLVMGSDYGANEMYFYNNLLENAIKQDVSLHKNIYLLVSEDDVCYLEHQKPYLELYKKYINTNLVITNSLLCYQHNKVTAYNIPMILSIILSLIEGAAPRFGILYNGDKNRVLEDTPINKETIFIATASHVSFDKNEGLLIEGEAFALGYPCPGFGIYSRKLILRNNSQEYTFPLGTALNAAHSIKYFNTMYMDYTGVGFTTVARDAISLKHIAEGDYAVDTSLEAIDIKEKLLPVAVDEGLDVKNIYGEFEYRLWSLNGRLQFSKKKLLNQEYPKIFFNLKKAEILPNSQLHVEGVFAISGIEVVNWGDVKYYLILKSTKTVKSFILGMSHQEYLNQYIGLGGGVYQKSYFCTYKREGVDISVMEPDSYDISISMSIKGKIFSQNASRKLIINIGDAYIS